LIYELIVAGIMISACLAIYFEEAIYSLFSLTIMFILTALLYSLNGAVYAALFQLTMGAGALAVFFLLSEELTEKNKAKNTLKRALLTVAISLLLVVLTIFSPADNIIASFSCNVLFPSALWELRNVDVVLQSLVILTVVLGASMVLYERRRKR